MRDVALQRIEQSRSRLELLRPHVLAGVPWPLADRFGTEPEATWGPPEVLAHVAEMLPFWLGELERILDGEQEPVPFGRIADDPLRIGVIGRDRTLPPRVLFQRARRGLDDWADRLRDLAADAFARQGRHPTLGELTVEALVERFVLGHVEEHLGQLERLVRRPS